MKTITLSILSLATAAVFAQSSYNVNNSKSKVQWHAEKVTGAHDGYVNVKSGKLEANNGKLTGGSFVMDMTTITCTDLEGEWNQKLVGHLNSDDFFSTAKHKTAKFVITKVTPKGNGKYEVSGNMTIKGITNPQTFMAEVSPEGNGMNAVAEITIDRTKYDIKYGSGSFFDDLGDKTIDDEFTLKVNLVTEGSKS